ncbi:MAG: Gfo/Idh/MocA family oxidoreductase [Roseitalea sp.]|jgi:predicted dehydrogenase|nr:Gfo/Idh/MocA family oxidoreductase [Roseitalea sp.]MBO6742362.1 Gfo/Idh/MocA family oxidoreductase [Roseitalea sp.]
MRFAIIGTGFVADYYLTTLANHPGLELAGVWDRDTERLGQFCAHWNVTAYDSQEALLADDTVQAVAVLTDPESHFEIGMAVLGAGKHLYSEKPLAMAFDDARALVDAAGKAELVLAGAPANARSDAFALTRATLEDGAIGAPKLVYAEMEDGPVFRLNWRDWRSVSGARWPGAHEFRIGCTLEHAGYALTWLIGLFGPVRRITGQSSTFFFDKGADIPPHEMAPDFSCALLEFDNGVMARLTSGLSAPRDRALTVMGEHGTLTVADLWDNRAAVHLEKAGQKAALGHRVARRLETRLGRTLPLRLPAGRKLPYDGPAKRAHLPAYPSQIDFCAGIAAIAACIANEGEGRQRLAAEALHVTEAALALNRMTDHGGRYAMQSTL